MAIQQINLGSQPKGVGGDNSREAGEKINANFEDLDKRVASAKSVADSKTTNATDAHLLNRANHTGTQSISTILGLQVALDSAASQIDITGNASTAGKLKTPVQINGVDFDGSQSINIVTPGGGAGGSTSYADTAGKLANPVQIHGVNFDGGAGFDIPNFTATKSGVVPAAGSDTTKYLRSDGTWVIPTDTQYTAMTATAANAGTATTAQIISPSVLKQAIQTHAPTGGGGGMNFAAKVAIELETVLDFVLGGYYTAGNTLSVSNQANIASAVIDSNGILCLTFNTPISNPNLIATTKSEVKTVTHEGEDYWYLTSVAKGNFTSPGGFLPNTFSIFQDAEKGYVNTNTKLYISCNLDLVPDYDDNTYERLGTYTLYSSFPARFNLGIIDA